jgi:protein-S-isoprenylcysteine O-methyltransferase Ste14
LVLKEEAFLMNIHGKEYEKYKNKTGRYIPRFVKPLSR